MKRYDAIVIGAGHNGLTCAAYLGKAGKKVLVLEAREVIGGIACGGEDMPGPAATAAGFRAAIVSELGLAAHGLKSSSRVPSLRATDGEQSITLSGDQLEGAGDDDTAAFARFREQIAGFRSVVEAFTDAHPIDLIHLERESKLPLLRRALGIRRLGRERMMELTRVAPMCAADWLDEFFESDLLKVGLAVPGLAQTWAPPRGPGTAANVLLESCRPSLTIEGGPLALTAALRSACEKLGVEIRTGTVVSKIAMEGPRAAGVVVDGGEDAEATTVICAINPRQALLDLLPRGILPGRTEVRMTNWRCRGSIAQLAVELEDEAELGADRVIVGTSLDDLERAFDAIKYREHSSAPVLDITSSGDWLSVRALYAPHQHAQGYGQDTRDAIEKAIMKRLEKALPELAKKTKSTRLWTPEDMERELRLPGGQLEHGEMALDQILVRPTPKTVGYRCPIDGLFLASSGSHPGGGISGLPGRLAAAAVLR